MSKYIFCLILGIMIYILLNGKDGFSIGVRLFRYLDPVSQNNYYYNTDTELSTWEYPDPTGLTIYPGPPGGPIPHLPAGPAPAAPAAPAPAAPAPAAPAAPAPAAPAPAAPAPAPAAPAPAAPAHPPAHLQYEDILRLFTDEEQSIVLDILDSRFRIEFIRMIDKYKKAINIENTLPNNWCSGSPLEYDYASYDNPTIEYNQLLPYYMPLIGQDTTNFDSTTFITLTKSLILETFGGVSLSGFNELSSIIINEKTFKLYSTTEYSDILAGLFQSNYITGNSEMENFKSNYYLFEVIESEEFLRGRMGLEDNTDFPKGNTVILQYITVFPLGKYYGTIFFLLLYKSNIILHDIYEPIKSAYDFYRKLLYDSVTKKNENSSGFLDNDTTDKFSFFIPDESINPFRPGISYIYTHWHIIYIDNYDILQEHILPFNELKKIFQEISTEQQYFNSFNLFLMKHTYKYWINVSYVPIKVFDRLRFMTDFNDLDDIEMFRNYIVN